jgi:hypothetical protein
MHVRVFFGASTEGIELTGKKLLSSGRILVALAVLTFVSCSDYTPPDELTTPTMDMVDRTADLQTGQRVVGITPHNIDLDLGAQILLEAGVYRDGQQLVSDAEFVWNSLDPEVARTRSGS